MQSNSAVNAYYLSKLITLHGKITGAWHLNQFSTSGGYFFGVSRNSTQTSTARSSVQNPITGTTADDALQLLKR